MATWNIILLAILAAVVLGSVGGVVIGKYLVKREKSNRKPVLSKRERIIYLACIALGTAFILFGVFFKFPGADNSMDMYDPGMIQDGGGSGGGAIMPRGVRGGGGVRIQMG
ncbi:MAG: hypothetical protein FWG94_02385 [Oscillospiraceae bacterium]|nr:hypothetical protein [Oscillospiraceae bacterium]